MKRLFFIAAAVFILSGCGLVGEKVENEKEQPGEVSKEEPAKKEENRVAESVPAEDPLEEKAEEEAALNVPQYRMKSDYSIESLQNPEEKIILLTIDDAPDKNALEMANTLKGLNVKAIFFVNGHFIDTPEEEAILKEIHEMGFSIGNHTMNHKALKGLSETEQRKEIVELNDKIEEITGERPKFFRAPFGGNTDISSKVAAEEKMLSMNWTYGYDWLKEYRSKEALTEIMVHSPLLRNGANLLMHDRKWTREALVDIVKGLQGKGYKIIDPELIET